MSAAFAPARIERCQCCDRELHPGRIKWLELNCRSGRWSDPGKGALSEEESQGLFAFGTSCAKRKLAAQAID